MRPSHKYKYKLQQIQLPHVYKYKSRQTQILKCVRGMNTNTNHSKSGLRMPNGYKSVEIRCWIVMPIQTTTTHILYDTGGKQIYKSVLNCIITQICGTRIGYWMDSNNKSKPDDNQLIFDLSSLQWLFWVVEVVLIENLEISAQCAICCTKYDSHYKYETSFVQIQIRVRTNTNQGAQQIGALWVGRGWPLVIGEEIVAC